MAVETLDDIIEELADQFGIYGCGPEEDHPTDCKCRICFVSDLTQRIETAAKAKVKHEIARYLQDRYSGVGRNASRQAAYSVAKDLALELVLPTRQQ